MLHSTKPIDILTPIIESKRVILRPEKRKEKRKKRGWGEYRA